MDRTFPKETIVKTTQFDKGYRRIAFFLERPRWYLKSDLFVLEMISLIWIFPKICLELKCRHFLPLLYLELERRFIEYRNLLELVIYAPKPASPVSSIFLTYKKTPCPCKVSNDILSLADDWLDIQQRINAWLVCNSTILRYIQISLLAQ